MNTTTSKLRELRRAEKEGREVLPGNFSTYIPPVAPPAPPDPVVSCVKCLVVHAEYAREIADGSKPIEYRSWGCRYRGWLAIQASKRADSGADSGRVVAFVQLVDVVEVGFKDFEWMLRNPIPVDERFGFPGRLGLFDVTGRVPAAWLERLAMVPIAPSPRKPNPRQAARKAPAKRRAKSA